MGELRLEFLEVFVLKYVFAGGPVQRIEVKHQFQKINCGLRDVGDDLSKTDRFSFFKLVVSR